MATKCADAEHETRRQECHRASWPWTQASPWPLSLFSSVGGLSEKPRPVCPLRPVRVFPLQCSPPWQLQAVQDVPNNLSVKSSSGALMLSDCRPAPSGTILRILVIRDDAFAVGAQGRWSTAGSVLLPCPVAVCPTTRLSRESLGICLAMHWRSPQAHEKKRDRKQKMRCPVCCDAFSAGNDAGRSWERH